jgi:DNA-binding transcriptional LysR family regulator
MASPKSLRLLSYFVHIARAGSISGAAAELRLSSAVVSEALSELEADMGATLARRTTRSFALTPLGEAVLNGAAKALDAADAAIALAGETQTKVSGVVRITAPTELAAIWLPGLLKGFEADAPDVRVEMLADDAFVQLGASPIDMAISAGYEVNAHSRRRNAAMLPLALVATPELLAGGPLRETLPAKIKRTGLVGRPGIRKDVGEVWAMPLRPKRSNTVLKLPASQRFAVDSQLVARELALAGLGAALLIQHSIEDALAAGRLQIVDPHYSYGFVAVRIRMRDRYPTAAARSLQQFLEAAQKP